jgi:hypothetical protein
MSHHLCEKKLQEQMKMTKEDQTRGIRGRSLVRLSSTIFRNFSLIIMKLLKIARSYLGADYYYQNDKYPEVYVKKQKQENRITLDTVWEIEQ